MSATCPDFDWCTVEHEAYEFDGRQVWHYGEIVLDEQLGEKLTVSHHAYTGDDPGESWILSGGEEMGVVSQLADLAPLADRLEAAAEHLRRLTGQQPS